MGRRFALVLVFLAGALALAGCGGSTPKAPKVTPSPHPTASATAAPTQITVIAPDGVNLRSGPATTASILGVVAQGVTLPIISNTSAAGGWWQVRGSTTTGWVSSDPQYTSTASFEMYQSSGGSGWSVLYPLGWQFAQQASGAIDFNGPQGESIDVTEAATTAQLPPGAPSGTSSKNVASVEVYGVTTSLVVFSVTSGYLAAVAFQAAPGLAFLIVAKGTSATATAAAFNLFLEAFKFPTAAASPTP